MLQLTIQNFSLQHTLASGQTFCWKKTGSTTGSHDIWKGYIYDIPCLARQAGNILTLESDFELHEELIRRYFNLNPEWQKVLDSLPDEPWLNKARRDVDGLRCLREPWWECTANFICSSLKQIPQIEQINQNLRRTFGEPITGCDAFRFPTAQKLASVTEAELRACKLGFRARHLSRAAKQIAAGTFCWEDLATLPIEEASQQMQSLTGVGEKVAHCILLYAGNRFEAFPVDVWVLRLMHELYFPKRRKAHKTSILHKKSIQLFGPHRGIAQQYLFHWYRTKEAQEKAKS